MLSSITSKLTNVGFVVAVVIVTIATIKIVRANVLGIQKVTGTV